MIVNTKELLCMVIPYLVVNIQFSRQSNRKVDKMLEKANISFNFPRRVVRAFIFGIIATAHLQEIELEQDN